MNKMNPNVDIFILFYYLVFDVFSIVYLSPRIQPTYGSLVVHKKLNLSICLFPSLSLSLAIIYLSPSV